MTYPEFRAAFRGAVPALGAALAGLCLSGCATQGAAEGPAGPTKAWRKIVQVENRFAVFINEPGAARQGDLATFRLAYVYAPGAVRFDDQAVGWQEYAAMTVNCVTREVRPGPRVRYAPDGKVLLSDDDQAFGAINPATVAEAAARARCDAPSPSPPATRIPDGRKWMDAARKRLAGAPTPEPAQ